MAKTEKGRRLHRRSFLRTAGLIGCCATAATFSSADTAVAFIFGSREQVITKTRLVMGTYVSITVVHRSRKEGEEAIVKAFAEIDRLNGILSRHLATTPLAELNRRGSLNSCPNELVEVLQRALHFHRETDGAFDVSILPVISLYEETFAAGNPPTQEQIRAVLQLVGADGITITGSDISLQWPGMGLTLDGIAKGYIIDRAAAILLANGMEKHLINGGGDIACHGSGAKGKAWTIAIQDPAKDRKYPEIIRMNRGALATSGNYEIFFDSEKIYHHIINPRNGRSPLQSKSVTIIAPTVMDADALATAVFVMEPGLGIPYVEKSPGVECFIIDKDDGVHKSKQWSATHP